MKKKKCFKCDKELPIENFYKHPKMPDGHLNKCKKCHKNDVSENYYNNRDYYAEYERKRYQKPKRREKLLEYQRLRRKKYPGKNSARQKLNNAVRDGKIEKQPCEVCGSEKVDGHHPDYRKPLDVKWLCRKHHLEEHDKVAY